MGQASTSCVLHIGAHRTGTTLLQQFMFRRRQVAREMGIHFIEIDQTRKQGWLDGVIYGNTQLNKATSVTRLYDKLQQALKDGGKVVLSDENIMGTMETNWVTKQLYPDIQQNLLRLGQSKDLFGTVCITLRSPEDWWVSALSFLAQHGHNIECFDTAVSKALMSKRGWLDVLRDLMSVMPNAYIVVKEFGFHTSNPKRQLREFTGWNAIKDIKSIPKSVSNHSNRGKKILREQFPYSKYLSNQQLSLEGTATLRSAYENELEEISSFLGSRGRLLSHSPKSGLVTV